MQRPLLQFPATALIFVSVLWIKAIYPPASGIVDPDFYWHLSTGRWILEHGALPEVDQFSWSLPGEPYRITQWLGEFVMAAAYELGGLQATKALSVTLAGVTIFFAWRAAHLFLGNSMLALWLAILCNLVNVVTPLRPQIFSFAAMAVLAFLLASWVRRPRLTILLPVPALMALWANWHGGYVVGLLLLFVFCCCQAFEMYRVQADGDRRRQVLWLFGASFVAVLATLLNPYGVGAWWSVLLVSGLQSSAVIEEWKAVQITTEMGWFLMMSAVPFLASLTIARRPPLTAVVLGCLFLFFGATANRQVAFAGAILPFVTAWILAGSGQIRQICDTTPNPSRPVLYTAILSALLAVAPWIQAKGDYAWESTMDGLFPASAHRFLETHGLTERVLADVPESNYLMFHGLKVSIDSRMDYYRDRFVFDYLLANRGAPGWAEWLDRMNPATLLLRHEVALRQLALASGHWKLVYQDDRYSVLVPVGSGVPEVPARSLEYLDGHGRLIRNYRP